MAITGRAALVALLSAIVIALSPDPVIAFFAVNALLVLGIITDVALATPVKSLRINRRGDTRARQFEEALVTLVVHNTSNRTARARIRDAWPPSAGSRPRVHHAVVPAGERRLAITTLIPTRRGDRRAERITVRSLGPLGLAGRQGRHVVPWTVRVLPPFNSRKHLPERLARLRQLDGLVTVNRRGQGTEFDSLREYVEGDDVRSIDWRATARRDAVVVRTWRPERDRRIVLVIDCGRTSAGRVGDTPRLDHSLDAALLVGAIAARAGDAVDFIAHDQRPRAMVRAGTRGDVLPTLVEAMTPIEPALVEVDHQLLVSQILKRHRQRALVILFTELNTAVIEEGLLPVLPSLTARHSVLLASVADPRVEVMAAGRGSARAVYDAAAAEHARTERQRLTALLRRRGVEVIDAPPDGFAPAVADRYLALKAAGLL
ncbi:MAG: DUF58 domain-containing protein [Mycobacteriales bacterium]